LNGILFYEQEDAFNFLAKYVKVKNMPVSIGW